MAAAERFSVVYHIEAESESEAKKRAFDICLEQTVELPEKLVTDEFISNVVVGKIEALAELKKGCWSARISYDNDTTGYEFTQFINVVFGNTSIKDGIKVQDILLSDGLLKAFTGPRFGTTGLRELLGVKSGPLLCTALKPMGSSSQVLADMAYKFALGGIDVIKDDHGLANQCWSRYEERVALCSAAVARANKETGKNCIYAPCLNAPAHLVMERAWSAKRAGAGGVLMLPGITGFDTMRLLAADPNFGLPILAHPAMLGSFSRDGFSHESLYGTLCRFAGADATIFPNYGGRFGFSKEECQSIAHGCRSSMGTYPSILPSPGGGMTLERVPEMKDVYGDDVLLLIGGDLIGRTPDLTANAVTFISATGRPEAAPAPVAAKAEAAPAERPAKRIKRPAEPPLTGNHSKVLAHSGDFTWDRVPLEDYKPPADNSWKGVTRTELIGKRGETPSFHVRYFEVAPGGHR
eukprot:gene3444-4328_t